MEKLQNWNDWCNDKILLHSSENNLPILLSPNATLAVEQCDGFTEVAMVDGLYFEVKETVEEFLSLVGEALKEGAARREAQAKAQEERYKAIMAEQKASEGK